MTILDVRSAVRLACFIGALGISGCASSPGAPLLRNDARDGHGALLPECQNVSPATPPLSYQTNFYLSTYSSAWSEGTQSGLRAGLKVEQADRSRVRFTKELSSAVVARSFGFDGSFPYPPFCMLYRVPAQRVHSAVAAVMPLLGGKVLRDQEALGVFATEFLDRQHTAAKWRDRYIVHVRELTTGETGVYVFRDLWISRQNDPHVRAQSNGGNEAWLLQRIAREAK